MHRSREADTSLAAWSRPARTLWGQEGGHHAPASVSIPRPLGSHTGSLGSPLAQKASPSSRNRPGSGLNLLKASGVRRSTSSGKNTGTGQGLGGTAC